MIIRLHSNSKEYTVHATKNGGATLTAVLLHKESQTDASF